MRKNYSKHHLDRGSQFLEEKITSRITSLISTESGKTRLIKMKQKQISFFIKSIERIRSNTNREKTRLDYLKLMENLISRQAFFIEKKICDFDNSKGIIVITGHFGIAKATKISQSDLLKTTGEKFDLRWSNKINSPLNNEPFPLRNASIFKTVFELFDKRCAQPHEVQMYYPFPFDEIQKDCQIACIYLDRGRQYFALQKQLDKFFVDDLKLNNIPIAIMFPERGTTGKRSASGNPFELESFSTGFAVYANHAQIPILPIVQIVGKNAEFITSVLEPVYAPRKTSQNNLSDFVETTRKSMQKEIDYLCHKFSVNQ